MSKKGNGHGDPVGCEKRSGNAAEKYFAMDLETLLLQQKRLCPFLEELVRLALEYTQAMETAKRKKRIVDFADIEHFALRILVDEKQSSHGIPQKNSADILQKS